MSMHFRTLFFRRENSPYTIVGEDEGIVSAVKEKTRLNREE